MSWFLRWFSEFTDLQNRSEMQARSVEQMTAEAEVLRAEHLKDSETIAMLTDRIDESRKSEIKAKEMVADFFSQVHYGRRLFDHVPELPRSTEQPEPVRHTRPQMRDLVAKMEREFIEQMKSVANPETTQ